LEREYEEGGDEQKKPCKNEKTSKWGAIRKKGNRKNRERRMRMKMMVGVVDFPVQSQLV